MVRALRLLTILLAPPRLAFGGTAPGPAPSIPPPPAPPPRANSPQGEAAADEARRRAMAARGYGSTIITGPMGDTSPATTTNNQLLGS